ncbi:MAG TPA: serine hydrolase [Streptosporangiaceae bacterium]|nr:serine hydrolase [Streptosporangiaceae bacterium]
MKADIRRACAAMGAITAACTLAALGMPASLATAATGATVGSGRFVAGSSPTAPADPNATVAQAGLTPAAKAQVGGPLMASTGVVVNYPARGAWKLPKIPASAYVIADANTGAVLAAKDPHGLFPPASTLKVLTAITMLPRLNPNAMLKASRLAVSQEPNIVGLVRGRSYKVRDLFHALLLISANDAAVTLVQGAGSFSKGMALVNAEAQHLQAYDVVAKLPNGLPATGQVVSAYDLALIARQALSMPAFMKYDETWQATFPVTNKKKITLINQNYLLTQYKGGIGGKIGWTDKAEATYIGMARRHGVTLIATILHCTPLEEITSAEKLLNWGFAMQKHVTPVGTLVPPLAPKPASASPSTAAHGVKTGGGPGAASSAMSGEDRGSGGAPMAIAAAIAGALCVGLVGLVFLRRRGATQHRDA